MQLTWDGQLRLVAVTDALGQVTRVGYHDGDALKITRLTDRIVPCLSEGE